MNHTVKFSDIVNLVADYNSAMYAPHNMCVHLGCDCGCGGDSYTPESWDDECKDADEAVQRAIDWCNLYGVEYDGMDV